MRKPARTRSLETRWPWRGTDGGAAAVILVGPAFHRHFLSAATVGLSGIVDAAPVPPDGVWVCAELRLELGETPCGRQQPGCLSSSHHGDSVHGLRRDCPGGVVLLLAGAAVGGEPQVDGDRLHHLFGDCSIMYAKFEPHSFFVGFAMNSHLHMPWFRGAIPLLIAGAIYVLQRRTARRFREKVAG